MSAPKPSSISHYRRITSLQRGTVSGIHIMFLYRNTLILSANSRIRTFWTGQGLANKLAWFLLCLNRRAPSKTTVPEKVCVIGKEWIFATPSKSTNGTGPIISCSLGRASISWWLVSVSPLSSLPETVTVKYPACPHPIGLSVCPPIGLPACNGLRRTRWTYRPRFSHDNICT